MSGLRECCLEVRSSSHCVASQDTVTDSLSRNDAIFARARILIGFRGYVTSDQQDPRRNLAYDVDLAVRAFRGPKHVHGQDLTESSIVVQTAARHVLIVDELCGS